MLLTDNISLFDRKLVIIYSDIVKKITIKRTFHCKGIFYWFVGAIRGILYKVAKII